jgi:hypothetical protein
VIGKYAASIAAMPHSTKICGRFWKFQKALDRGAKCGSTDTSLPIM